LNVLYSTFVMRNDSFIPGALVLGYALKKQGLKDPVVCFITQDVSIMAQTYLKAVFDDVITIDTVKIEHENKKGRQDRSDLFTRLEIMKFTEYKGKKLDKIIVLDGDILPLLAYENLKDIESYGAILNESKDTTAIIENHQYIVPPSVINKGKWLWHEIYHDIPHGSKVPKDITDRVFEDDQNLGMNTSLWVFKPSREVYTHLMSDLSQDTTQARIQHFNWPEMQYLTGALSGQWHNIDIKYASFNGYPRIDLVYGIHYAGVKPWAIQHRSFSHYSKFPDFRLWQKVFIKMMKEIKPLKHYKKLTRIQDVLTMQFQKQPFTSEEQSHAPKWV